MSDRLFIPFAEAVGADALIAQIVTDAGEDLLHFSGRNGEDPLRAAYAVPQTVVFYVLLDYYRSDC